MSTLTQTKYVCVHVWVKRNENKSHANEIAHVNSCTLYAQTNELAGWSTIRRFVISNEFQLRKRFLTVFFDSISVAGFGRDERTEMMPFWSANRIALERVHAFILRTIENALKGYFIGFGFIYGCVNFKQNIGLFRHFEYLSLSESK